jgi:hypothetical protein
MFFSHAGFGKLFERQKIIHPCFFHRRREELRSSKIRPLPSIFKCHMPQTTAEMRLSLPAKPPML